jgi:PAS domain S-box-containing protein
MSVSCQVKFSFPKSALLISIVLISLACISNVVDAQTENKETNPDEITAVVLSGSPPLQFRDKKTGNASGFAVDLLYTIAERSGLNVTFTFASSWSEMIQTVVSGKADVIASLAISEERRKVLKFTNVIHSSSISIFVRSKNETIKSLGSGLNVGTTRGSIANRFINKVPDIKMKIYDSYSEGLFSLLAGEIDAFVSGEEIFLKLARDAGVGDRIKVVGKPFLNIKRAMALGKDKPHLQARLNKAIAGFVGSPEYQDIYVRWYGKPTPYWTRQRTLLVMSVFLIAIASGMALWRYRSVIKLNRELINNIAERKAVENNLRESENKFKSLYKSMTEGVALHEIIYDELNKAVDYKIVDVNPAYESITGLSRDQSVGSKASELYKTGTAPYLDIYFKVASSGEPESFETYFPPMKKHFSVSVFSPAKGKFATVFEDITIRKEAEENIRVSEERYQNLFSSMRDVIIVADKDRIIVNANQPALRDIFGYELEEILGKQTKFLYADEQGFEKTGKEVFDKDKALVGKIMKVDFKKKSGKMFTGEMYALKLLDKDRTPRGNLGIIRDITDRKALEEELQKSHKLESIGILAGGIAHDFNNLLAAILNNIYLSKAYAGTESKAYNRLEYAEKAVMRAGDLTQQLLTFSKGGAPVKKITSIVEVINESAEFVLRGSNVKCEYDLADNLWAADVDVGQISQVIQNLLINADQSMPEGGIININAENTIFDTSTDLPLQGGKYVKISVRDQGMGISEDNLHKIFDPFFTTKETGRGLGLSTSYSIIKNHDGHIAVESEPGKGSTVTVYLPAYEKQITSNESDDETNLHGEGHVLIMDDEEMVRSSLGKMLTTIGYEVELARNGTEAIALYEKAKSSSNPIDAVILDLTVPGEMGGKDAIRKLLDIDPQIKAIVTSGYSNDPVMANFREYGFIDVVTKPYTSPSELNKILHKVINGM